MLTDKREFVVGKPTIGTGYLLFNKDVWRRTDTAEYRVDEDGRFSRQGRITHWRVKHLIDTGRNIDDLNGADVVAATTTTAAAAVSSVSNPQQ